VLAAFALGVGLGAFVAAQVGPIWLLLARTALRHGVRPAAAIGVGAAGVDTAYAALGALGAAPLLAWGPARLALGLAGTLLLVVLGVRTLRAARHADAHGDDRAPLADPRRALRTSVVATAANPLTVASWAALFSAAFTARVADAWGTGAALVAGVGVGSTGLMLGLALVLGRTGARLPRRALVVADVVAGAGLVVFGLVLGARTVTV
jgi:putative LysE/RhtB family amino acid efflux pump